MFLVSDVTMHAFYSPGTKVVQTLKADAYARIIVTERRYQSAAFFASV